MRKIIILVLVLMVLLAANSFAGDFGESSFPVLMIENFGARQLALADSGVSISGDLNSITANPAGAVGIERPAFSAMRLNWMFDTSFYSIAGALPLGERLGVVAISGIIFTMEEFEGFVDGVSAGALSSGDFLFGASYANNIFALFNKELAAKLHIDFGTSIKFAQAKLGDYSAATMAFDFGLNYSLRIPNFKLDTAAVKKKAKKTDSLTISVAYRNLPIVLQEFVEGTAVEVPSYFHFGFKYNVVESIRHDVMITANLKKPTDGDFAFSTGVEYCYHNVIYLRGGYHVVGRENESITFGVGLNFEISEALAFQLDYTTLNQDDLGSSEVISFSMAF